MSLYKKRIRKYLIPITGNFIFLLLSISAFSQDENISALTQKFTEFQEQNFQEKIFVHTDKSLYLAGEIMWFKVYAVDEFFNMPSDISKISYVEILDKDDKPVLQAKINMQDGDGNGSFAIPPSLATGNYILRAYTNWMKNFSPDFYFQQQLTIINTLKELQGNDTAESQQNIIAGFFPEGGNLVDGMTSKVGFKVTDEYGDGIDCSGTLLDENNNHITDFKSLCFGMGNFIFTPQQGHNYHAVIKTGDSVIIKKLPDIYQKGYVMSLSNSDADKVKITVKASENLISGKVYLFTQSHNLLKSIQQNNITNGEAVFYSDRKLLADGITQFTVFNDKRQPVCERLYFKRPENKLVISAKSDANQYLTRQKVTIDLQATDQNNLNENTDMSISVFKTDSLQSPGYLSIEDYLMLTSDLKGKIESPGYYFKKNNPEADEAVDNLMLTQGWRRFKWDDILQNKKNYFQFLPENEGPLITAKITDKATGLPANNITGYLSVPGDIFTLSSSASDSDGNIIFNAKKFYGKREMIVQTNNETDSNYRMDITDPFSEKFSDILPSRFSLLNKWKDELAYDNINVQVENSYQTAERHRYYTSHVTDSTQFYGIPDHRYNLDDYIRYITMEEVLKEFVTDVRARKESDKYNLRIYNLTTGVFFDDNPLVLIDGVPIFDMNKIMSFDPLKIRKIEVVSRKNYMGSLINDGILSFATYNNDLSGYNADPGAIVLEYEGIQNQREFYTPEYSTSEKMQTPLPDVRNQLFWSPNIKITNGEKKEVTFYTSDLTGKFVIVVQGLTSSGLPGSATATFNVAPQ